MAVPFHEAAQAALQHLETELDAIRTGRANPALVENIPVDAYGSTVPLQQLASISVPEPRVLVVQPWDPSTIKDIEKALSQSSLGINPVVDSKLIRLPFPSMTEERRREMVKSVGEIAETVRVRIRAAREDVMKDIKRREADGDVSEDAAENERTSLQESVDDTITTIQTRVTKKEEELMTV